MPLKALISSGVHAASYVTGNSARRAKRLDVGRIITFHVVGFQDCPADVFAEEIEFLRAHFQIISLAAMVQELSKTSPNLSGRVVLTFDDGTRSTFTTAYPILKRAGVPATLFVCPGLVDSGHWLWNRECRYRLFSLPAAKFAELADSLGVGNASPNTLVEWLKTLPTRSRLHIEQVIRAQTPGYCPTADERNQNELMSWDELAALDASLITIGGHSTNHPILACCSSQELGHEISDCRTLIEARLGRPVEFFCYPNGEFNPLVVNLVRETYAAAVTTRPGFVTGGANVFQLSRLSCAPTLPLFTWRLFRPSA